MIRRMDQDRTVRIQSRGVLIGLLCAWAVMRWLSFHPANLWLLAHLAYLPLALAAARAASTRQLIGWTYLAGFFWWLIGVVWLSQVTLGGYVALCFYLGLYPVGFVLIVRGLDRGWRLPYVVTVPLAVVTTEWVRSWLMTGFPWFNLAQSQPTVLIQVADFAGALGVSVLPAMSSGFLMDLLLRPLGKARQGRFRLGGRFMVSTVLWGATLGLALGYGMLRVAEYHNLRGTVPRATVAVVQSDLPQEVKNDAVDPMVQKRMESALIEEMDRLTRQAAEAGADLIVWPETIVPRPLNDDTIQVARWACEQLRTGSAEDPDWGFYEAWCPAAGYRRRVEDLARDLNVPLIVGAHAYLGLGGTDVQRYNSAYHFDAGGDLADRYDKLHRVPFGEYVPFRESAPWLANALIALTPYDRDYSLEKGDRIVRFDIPMGRADPDAPGDDTAGDRPWRVATPICFEDVVSHVARRMIYTPDGAKRGDLLVNLTNDGWYPGSAQGWQHEQIARFRCVELRAPMARSVNRGVSGFIDSLGRVTDRVAVDGQHQMVSGTASAELTIDPRRTVFGRWGNPAAQAITGVTALLLIAGRLRNRKEPHDDKPNQTDHS